TRVHVDLSRPTKTLIAPDRFSYNAILPLHAESVLMTRRGVMAHSWAPALLLAMVLPALAHAQDEGTTGAGPAATATPSTLSEADYYKTIKVIQKRPVTKARRLEICPFFSYLPNDDC